MALQKHQYIDRGLIYAEKMLRLSSFNPFVKVDISFNKELTIENTVRLENVFIRHLNNSSHSSCTIEKFETYDDVATVHFGKNNESCLYILNQRLIKPNESAVHIVGYLQDIISAGSIVAGEIIKDIVGKGWKSNLQKKLRDIINKSDRPVYYLGIHNWSYMDDVYINHKAYKAELQGATTESGAVCYNQAPLLVMPLMFYQIYEYMHRAVSEFNGFLDDSIPRYFSVEILDLRKFCIVMEDWLLRPNKVNIKGIIVYISNSCSHNLSYVLNTLVYCRDFFKTIGIDISFGIALSLHHFDKNSSLKWSGLIDFIREYENVSGEKLFDFIGLTNIVSDYVSCINYEVLKNKGTMKK